MTTGLVDEDDDEPSALAADGPGPVPRGGAGALLLPEARTPPSPPPPTDDDVDDADLDEDDDLDDDLHAEDPDDENEDDLDEDEDDGLDGDDEDEDDDGLDDDDDLDDEELDDEEDEALAALVATLPPRPTLTLPEAVPAASAPPTAGSPEAVRPQEAARRAAVQARERPSRRLDPGDLICGECGEGNAPTRKFCSRCGSSLVTAVPVRSPWWRRLARSPVRRVKAGVRPGQPEAEQGRRFSPERAKRLARTGIALTALVLTTAYAVLPPVRQAVNGRVATVRAEIDRRLRPQYVPVHPVQVRATAELPERSGSMAADGFSNTFWVAPVAAKDPALVLTFDRPVRLGRALLRSGTAERYLDYQRPAKLHVVYGNGVSEDVPLKDTPEVQEIRFREAPTVTHVELYVRDLYRAVKPRGTAVTEIEFFARS